MTWYSRNRYSNEWVSLKVLTSSLSILRRAGSISSEFAYISQFYVLLNTDMFDWSVIKIKTVCKRISEYQNMRSKIKRKMYKNIN